MRVFIKNFGCSANLADGEVLAGCLAEAGFKLVHSASKADLMIYNTCAVKGPTENRMIDAIKRAPRGKKVIVTGCLPLINFERLCCETRFNGAVGPVAAEKIVNVAKRVLKGEKVIELQYALDAKPLLSLPQLRSNPVISVIPVSYGCLGACAYCCVVFARGQLRSYAINEVTERVQKDLVAGAKEFWLTSQDTGCYGIDIGTNLAALLNAINDVRGYFKVRIGMMTPNVVAPILDDLVEAFKNEKVFKFLHLPVQSGDDHLLQRMRRLYSAQDFKDIVDAFRNAFPKITLATDVICGFPSETHEAFENTLQLVEETKPDIVNISKFFARPHTAAAEMRNFSVDMTEIKRRSTAAARVASRISLERNQSWIGWAGEVLVDEKGKTSDSWIGRNFAYKPVVIRSRRNMLGKTLNLKITDAFSTYLNGAIC